MSFSIDTIMRLMAQLARNFPHFENEDAFQRAFHNGLIICGVDDCDREVPFRSSDHFLNEENIEVDQLACIATGYCAIELKYVHGCYPCSNERNMRPHDAQAFPYDMILDCARIESLIRFGHHDHKRRQMADGAAIGLTNDERIWRPDEHPDWWSKNLRLPDTVDGQRWTTLPRQFYEISTTSNRPDIRGAIFINDRYHIRLYYRWEYRWFIYSEREGANGLFRYIVVRPRRNAGGELIPASNIPPPDPLTTLPFEGAEEKLAALKHRLEHVRELHNERPSRKSEWLRSTLPGTIAGLE